MSGQLEDMQEEISRLSTALARVCAKTGHEMTTSSWQTCKVLIHRDAPSRADHRTSCDICGTFKCEEQGS